MNRLDQLVGNGAHAEGGRGATTRRPVADDGPEAFRSVLHDLSRPAVAPDASMTAAENEGVGVEPARDGGEHASDDAAGDLAEAVARLLFAATTTVSNTAGGDGGDGAPQTGEGRLAAEASGKGSAAAADAARLPAVTVLVRETHFAPIRRILAEPMAADRDIDGTAVTAAGGRGGEAPVDDAAAAHDRSGARSVPFAPRGAKSPSSPGGAPHLPGDGAGATPQRIAGAATSRPGEATAPAPSAAGAGRTSPPGPLPTGLATAVAGGDPAAEPETAAGVEDAVPATDGRKGAPSAAAPIPGDLADASPARADAGAASAAGADPPPPGETALPAATLQRLAGAIAAAAGDPTAASASADTFLGEAATAPGGPVRILVLRLQPEALGSVTIRLRIVDGALELRFQATNPETADLIERDRQVLRDCLKASGYDTDVLAVQTAPREGARHPADQANPPPVPNRHDGGAGSGFSPGGDRPPPGRDGAADDRQRHPPASPRSTEQTDETHGRGSRPGALYL